MKSTSLDIRPELDELWPRLRNDERTLVSNWCEIARRMALASDKAGELVLVIKQFTGTIPHLSRNTVYRKLAEIRNAGPVAGVIGKAALARAQGKRRAPTLPPGFIAHWRELCGMHQRQKTLTVWHMLMDELRAGKIIPGYGKDWRGIWLEEHPGEALPTDETGAPFCPYTRIHAGSAACAPRGWGYANLIGLRPEPDVMAGAAIGVHAMTSFAPVVPHTRIGLRPMSVITMDDVKLDQFCWVAGEREPRRPVGLGVMDVCTGCIVDFTLVPAFERADGTVSGLSANWAKYVWANVFCNLGVDPESGVLFLAEHGSAGLSKEDEERINTILGPRPDGGPWLTVMRSSTSGAPLLKGLFTERGRGRPTHKAMIEALWNLLHNEMAALPAPSGRNWDAAPQDVEGWAREDKALIEAGARAILAGCPDAVAILRRGQTNALSYTQLEQATRAVINTINHRNDHAIQDWEECGFVRSVVPFGGQLLPLDRVLDDISEGDPVMRETMAAKFAPKQRAVRLSPAEAWATFDPKQRKVFNPFVATQILGDALAQEVEINARHQFVARDDFSGRQMLFASNIRRPDGAIETLLPGEKLKVWVNPIRTDWALVSRRSGEFIGAAKYMAPTVFGETTDAHGNLAELAIARADQRRRVATVVGAKLQRTNERRAANQRVLATAFAAPDDAASRQLNWQISEGADDIDEI